MSAPADGSDDEWRYSLEDLEDEDDEDEDGGEGVAGTIEPSETIEPGDIDPENAAFVLLGVLLASAMVASYVLLAI